MVCERIILEASRMCSPLLYSIVCWTRLCTGEVFDVGVSSAEVEVPQLSDQTQGTDLLWNTLQYTCVICRNTVEY